MRPEDLGSAGRGVIHRPWQISVHKDAGFKGIADPEILRLLCCSIIGQGTVLNVVCMSML